jgi:organic hydroperoxide reductase OsmC/OhrA
MTTVASKFSLHVEQLNCFEFRVKFDKEQFAPLLLDEPPPLGHDTAPNAARILAAAIGNCLSASLLFCLQRAKVAAASVSADVDVEIVRNEARRLRVGKVNVTLHTNLPADDPSLAGCLSTFEDFCVVTQSVRHGIDVAVKVEGAPSTSD